VQGVAAWLVARPHNGILALAASASLVMLPLLQVVSGVVMMLLTLANGMRMAAIQAMFAGALLAVIAAVFSIPLAVVPTLMLVLWAPMLLLGLLLAYTRSLTLTLQVSVLATVAFTVIFYLAVSDLQAFWAPKLELLVQFWRQSGMQEQADALLSQKEAVADVAAVMVGFSGWMLYAVGCLLGYSLYRLLPRETGDFGRFQDLNFGRIVAMTVVLVVTLGLLFGATWLLNIAVVLMVVFALQGFAIVFWMYRQGILPIFGLVVVAVLVMLPRLNVLVIMSLALAGYADAWFGLRKRMATNR
jgi:hypothetical protein